MPRKSQPKFDIFNNIYYNEPTPTFHQFESLPSELRLRIWKFSLPKRFITVDVYNGPRASIDNNNPRYSGKNHLGKPISGDRYHIRLAEGVPWTPQLLICHESREVAVRCFRLRIPIALSKEGTSRLLHLDPDRDHLYVRSLDGGAARLAHLLVDLQAYDPVGVGIRHLMMSAREVQDLQPAHVGAPTSTAGTLFEEALRSLQSLWVVAGMYLDRTVWPLGPICIHRRLRHDERGLLHSVPIFCSNTPSFDLLRPDPRDGIEPDLKKLYASTNPQHAAQAWRDMEGYFGVRDEDGDGSESRSEISYVITTRAELTGGIYDVNVTVKDRKSLDRYLRKEKNNWEFDEYRIAGTKGKMSPCHLPPAVGFWLFPDGTFDGFTKPNVGQGGIFNGTEVRKPVLGLFHL